MLLKHYQQQTLDALRAYLLAVRGADNASAGWSCRAWERAGHAQASYRLRSDGAGQELPSLCLKVPTGGGKTLLAVHAIDAINQLYRRTRHSLVLWIVPTTQIYRQTLASLRDRSHPYRQVLDLSSGGRTRVLERDDPLLPADLAGQLVLLVLMLPAANRRNKATLRLFQDHSGLAGFFPPDDDWRAHTALLDRVPNLDSYKDGFGPIVKSSLGNTLRMLRPLLILDEGHRAYSPGAQATLLGLNPAFVLELSATPAPSSNLLVAIGGRQLHREGMIKLDLQLHRPAGDSWCDTLRASHTRRAALEQAARDYRASGGAYIRPICLIQVERTGATQRGHGHIHAEDARAFLIERCGVPPEQIAVKSSECDEIERIDLLSECCPIRYLITRQALQEGWDCPFAYILTVLTNPASATGMTQLVGRVLRQPYARKTGVLALDQSYVYYRQASAEHMLALVRAALVQEGLGDLAGHVVVAPSSAAAATAPGALAAAPARQLLIADGDQLRPISYERDLLPQIDWEQISLAGLAALGAGPAEAPSGGPPPDPVGLTRQLGAIIPNPWRAYGLVNAGLALLREQWGEQALQQAAGVVAEALRQQLTDERERLVRAVLDRLAHAGVLRWYHAGGGTQAASTNDSEWEHSIQALLRPPQ